MSRSASTEEVITQYFARILEFTENEYYLQNVCGKRVL